MSSERKYRRFSIPDRIEHWVQMASFTLLGLTGLIQKFSGSSISVGIISSLGGIESVRVIHRIAAIGLMLGTIFHFGTIGYKFYVKRSRITMLPGLGDVRAAWNTFLFNLGKRTTKPQQGRYTFDEKFEYWAFVWGTVVMGLTGFMLWNPIATTRFLPGIFIPAAKAAHSGEALLAVLAIVIWHFYNVHIKHFNTSMFTGHLTEEQMLEEHPLELADIKAGIAELPQDPKAVSKRKRRFFPVYGVVAAAMLFGVFQFVTIEDTAITTLPPAEQVAVFAPLTPTPLPTPLPTPTPLPVSDELTWESGIALTLEERCSACHSEAAALGELNLSNFQNALDGGSSGPAIVPSDPDASLLVTRQSTGDHPGQLTADELTAIIEWIEAGAPDK